MDGSNHCVNHPARKALSICHNCREAFCADCLTEGGEFYYCRRPSCRAALAQITLPPAVTCRYCRSELKLSALEQTRGRFECPACWHLYKWPESEFFLKNAVSPFESTPQMPIPSPIPEARTDEAVPSPTPEPRGARLLRMLFTGFAGLWSSSFFVLWIGREIVVLLLNVQGYQRRWQDPLLYWSFLFSLILTLFLWRTGRIQRFFTLIRPKGEENEEEPEEGF